ncbi:MAG: hypothetical protein AB7G93_05040 [Bdellovibrionales bacterium]
MQKKSVFSITLCSLVTSLFLHSAQADIEWSGVYRIEGYHFKNPEMGGRGKELGFGLHHLVLRPKIVAGDGLTIHGQFDILNNDRYPNSQLGQVWGSGLRDPGGAAATSAENSNVLSERQKADTFSVSQVYLTLTQEYGALIVGRAPLQFGLGMTHSAGRGLFDHWYDTRDLVGYKFLIGNMYILPMIGKPSEGEINRTDDVTDYMIQAAYENPETDLELGVFYQMRRAGDQGSDAPAGIGGGPLGGTGAANAGEVDARTVNLYALKDTETLRLGFEASFQSGESGVIISENNVGWEGFGIAAEFGYRPEGSSWQWGLNAGMATGDDPETNDKFEGFLFDRNYDVAMLMFNQPLGHYDLFRTQLLNGTSVRDADGFVQRADVETISNVIYLVPRATYVFNDRWSLENRLATGWLNTNPLSGGQKADKDLGYEWDISLSFAPRKGVVWTTQAGLLFPGSAWEGGGQYDSKFGYGLATKAAISF